VEVIAGQGTIGLEVLAADPAIDCLAVPVGGGGLLARIATAAETLRPDIRILGVQSAAYPHFARALRGDLWDSVTSSGGAATIADGIAVELPGETARRIAAELVDDVVTVTEASAATSTRVSCRRSPCEG
jgi:threonine dehydratase